MMDLLEIEPEVLFVGGDVHERMPEHTARFLDREDLADVADAGEYVDVVREAYREHARGAPTEPRTALERSDPVGLLNAYVAILPEAGVMGGYVYAAGFEDADAWLMTPLFDARTGRPLALLDGAPFNTYKTGAVGAVGIDALARDDARVLAIFGSGAQALGQVRAALTVRSFEEVLVHSPTREHREAFAERIAAGYDVEARACKRPVDAVRPADVIVTATNASEPVFDGDDVAPGTHVTAVGQYHPDKRELDATLLARATYVPDLRERVARDAGAFLLAVEEGAIDEDHVHATLGEVVAGLAPGRTSEEEITVFDSGGTALETVASAGLAYRRALERDRGTPITFSSATSVYEGKRGSTADELE